MKHNHYTKDYFKKRDLLDLHIADSVLFLARREGAFKVLDVGCGSGQMVAYLQKNGIRAYGSDISRAAVVFAKKITKQKTIIKASATKLPFKNASFDMITSVSMIEHISKEDGILFIEEVYRILKPDGLFFIITPNFNSPLRYLQGTRWFGYSDPTHIYFYTPASLRKVLVQLGFKNIQTKIPSIKITSDLHIPHFLKSAPWSIKQFLTYLMISSPLSTWRDSFWMTAHKSNY